MDEKRHLGYVGVLNFAQGFGFASSEAISEAREFSKTHQWDFAKATDF